MVACQTLLLAGFTAEVTAIMVIDDEERQGRSRPVAEEEMVRLRGSKP